MSKATVIEAIVEQVKALGVSSEASPLADIVFNAKFVSKSLLGQKIVMYQASIIADETSRTVHHWEKTSEESKGLSFGMQAESSSYSQGAVHRRVQITTVGSNGKLQSVSIDLAAISKAIESAAKNVGWAYKAEGSRRNAQYPT